MVIAVMAYRLTVRTAVHVSVEPGTCHTATPESNILLARPLRVVFEQTVDAIYRGVHEGV